MGSVIKELQSNNSKNVIFDDTSFPKLEKPLSKEEVKELENTLGRALMDRFKKELSASNIGPKKE